MFRIESIHSHIVALLEVLAGFISYLTGFHLILTLFGTSYTQQLGATVSAFICMYSRSQDWND